MKLKIAGAWMIKDMTLPCRVSLWRSVRAPWEEVKLNSKVKWGNGNKTKF